MSLSSCPTLDGIRPVSAFPSRLARLGRFDPELLSPIRHRGAEAQADLQILRSRDALLRSRTALKAWGAALPNCTAWAFHRRAAGHIPEESRPALL